MNDIHGNSNPTFLTDHDSRNAQINTELVLNVLNTTILSVTAFNRLVEMKLEIG